MRPIPSFGTLFHVRESGVRQPVRLCHVAGLAGQYWTLVPGLAVSLGRGLVQGCALGHTGVAETPMYVLPDVALAHMNSG